MFYEAYCTAEGRNQDSDRKRVNTGHRVTPPQDQTRHRRAPMLDADSVYTHTERDSVTVGQHCEIGFKLRDSRGVLRLSIARGIYKSRRSSVRRGGSRWPQPDSLIVTTTIHDSPRPFQNFKSIFFQDTYIPLSGLPTRTILAAQSSKSSWPSSPFAPSSFWYLRRQRRKAVIRLS